MTKRRETRVPGRQLEETARQPITSERILRIGLRLIDQQGLEALIMRIRKFDT